MREDWKAPDNAPFRVFDAEGLNYPVRRDVLLDHGSRLDVVLVIGVPGAVESGAQTHRGVIPEVVTETGRERGLGGIDGAAASPTRDRQANCEDRDGTSHWETRTQRRQRSTGLRETLPNYECRCRRV